MGSDPNYVDGEHCIGLRMQFLPQTAYFSKIIIVHYDGPCKLGEQELRGDPSELDMRAVEILSES